MIIFDFRESSVKNRWSPSAIVFVAEIFTGSPGKYVSLADAIKGFNMILSGELDDLPEQSFYLVGDIDEAIAKAESLQ